MSLTSSTENNSLNSCVVLSRPQRGSFPLDHDGEWTVQNNTFNGRSLTKATAGECKTYMTKYLSCMKKVRGLNDEECRDLAKAYLSCRMDR